MAVDGYLNFNTKINTSGFNSGTKQITAGLTNIKTSLGAIGKAAVAAFSVKELVSFGQQAISIASDLEEVQNVVEVSFGSMTHMMEEFADKAIIAYGISELTAKQTGSTYMAMAKGMGIAQDAATDMSVALTGLSADMASFYNKDQNVTATALNSVFTGETETLKQFGIVMTEANLEAYALRQGIKKSVSEMSQAEKVQLRYNYVMQQTSLAHGDFARTSDGWANQTRILSEVWKEFSGTVGIALTHILLPAVKSLSEGLMWLNGVANAVIESLADVFGWELESKSAASVEDMKNAFSDANDEQKELIESTKEYQNQLMGFDRINKLSNNNSGSSDSELSSVVPLIPTIYSTEGSKNGILDDAEKELTAFQQKIKELTSSLAITFNDVFIDWEDLTGEQIAEKVITGLFALAGGIIGFKFGGVKGAAIGVSIGAALSLIANDLLFDQDGEFSTQEIVKMIVSALGTIAGGVIGFLIGGPGGVPIGASIGMALSLIINELTFDQDGGLSVDEIVNLLTVALGTTLYGPLGTGLALLVNSLVNWEELGNNIIEKLSELWSDITEFFSPAVDWFDQVFSEIGLAFDDVFEDIASIAEDCWDSIVTFFSPAIDWFDQVFSEIGLTVDDVFDNIEGIAEGCWESIQLVFGEVYDWVDRKVITPVSKIFSDMWSKISQKAVEAWKGIQDAFGHIAEWFGEKFSRAWKIVRDVFSAGGQIFSGIKEGILNALKSVINALISGINTVIAIPFDGINSALSKIKNISILGVQPFYDKISFIHVPQIPKLATGHVVPANYGEFLAILGDNNRETEVVSPLSTIEKAVENVMGKYGGNETINVIVTLDGKVIYTEVVKRNKQNTKITGVNALA